jgi:hypothetical protein
MIAAAEIAVKHKSICGEILFYVCGVGERPKRINPHSRLVVARDGVGRIGAKPDIRDEIFIRRCS